MIGESIQWSGSYTGLLAILFLSIIILVMLNLRRQLASIATITTFHPHLLRNFSLSLIWFKAILIIGGLIALFIAYARPQWGLKEQKIMSKGRDVVIALDTSRSMLAENRLEQAKKKIKDLVYALEADRVGLILFSENAFIHCPLTVDRAIFFLFLDTLDHTTMACATTLFEPAIKKAVEIFENMPEKQTRLLLLVTDGEEFAEKHDTLKELLKKQNISLWCLGVGTIEGAPIPLYDEYGNQRGHIKDRQGNIVISHFNPTIITELVKVCAGHYLHITNDNKDIAELIKWVNRYEKQQNSEALHVEYEDRFYLFTGCAFLAFLLQWIL